MPTVERDELENRGPEYWLHETAGLLEYLTQARTRDQCRDWAKKARMRHAVLENGLDWLELHGYVVKGTPLGAKRALFQAVPEALRPGAAPNAPAPQPAPKAPPATRTPSVDPEGDEEDEAIRRYLAHGEMIPARRVPGVRPAPAEPTPSPTATPAAADERKTLVARRWEALRGTEPAVERPAPHQVHRTERVTPRTLGAPATPAAAITTDQETATMSKTCNACKEPGTRVNRVGPSGYHVDCNPGPEAGTTTETGGELPPAKAFARRLRFLAGALERGDLELADVRGVLMGALERLQADE